MRFIFGFVGMADLVYGVIVSASTAAQATLGGLAVLVVISVALDNRRRG